VEAKYFCWFTWNSIDCMKLAPPSMPALLAAISSSAFSLIGTVRQSLTYRRGPRHLAHALDGARLHRLGLQLGVGLGDRHRLARRAGHAVRRHVVGGGKAVGAVADHAHADAGRFGVGDVLDVQVAGGDELVQVAADAHVAVAGAGLGGRVSAVSASIFLAASASG
jgi:hypothetical protein